MFTIFLEKCNVVLQGNTSESHARCNLIKKNDLLWPRKLVSLSKNELRSMSEKLTLPFGSETSTHNLIVNVSN